MDNVAEICDTSGIAMFEITKKEWVDRLLIWGMVISESPKYAESGKFGYENDDAQNQPYAREGVLK